MRYRVMFIKGNSALFITLTNLDYASLKTLAKIFADRMANHYKNIKFYWILENYCRICLCVAFFIVVSFSVCIFSPQIERQSSFFPLLNLWYDGYTVFESTTKSGFYLRAVQRRLVMEQYDGTEKFKQEASFKTHKTITGKNILTIK